VESHSKDKGRHNEMETKKAIQKNQGNKRHLLWMRIEIDTEPNNNKKGEKT
jgi:hypothetical protein